MGWRWGGGLGCGCLVTLCERWVGWLVLVAAWGVLAGGCVILGHGPG